MSEHHTQGRQGQGARHHRRYRSNRNYRHRMPRPEDAGAKKKPSLFKRVLAFFGIGKKKAKPERKKERPAKNGAQQQPPQRVRVAQPKNTTAREGSGSAAKGRRRPASVPPTDQARLYVGNLSFEATEAEVEDLFKGFGRVRSVEIIYNTRTYRSKGYAFVEMEQLADARRAAEVLHGQPFMGRELMVSAASEKMESREKAPEPRERKEAGEATPREPVPSPKSSEDELEADFGEEIVVPLGQSAALPEAEAAPQPAEQQPRA